MGRSLGGAGSQEGAGSRPAHVSGRDQTGKSRVSRDPCLGTDGVRELPSPPFPLPSLFIHAISLDAAQPGNGLC